MLQHPAVVVRTTLCPNAICEPPFETCASCPADCPCPNCGDGVIQMGDGEECDDGHMPPDDGDGCNSSCTVEAGWGCIGEPSVCIPSFNLDGSSSPGAPIPDCAGAAPGSPCTVGDGNEGVLADTISFATACTVADINIDMDISHPNKGDLRVELTSPGGTTVRLHNQTGCILAS